MIIKISTQLDPYNKASMQWEGQFLLGRIYLKQENFEKSEFHMIQGLESLRTFELEESINQGLVLEELGNLFYIRNDYK